MITLLFLGSYNIHHNGISEDMGLYFNGVEQWSNGKVPFKDFNLEYPPGALLLLSVPYVLSNTIESYKTSFTVFSLIFILIGFLLLYEKRKNWKMIIYGLLLLCMPSEMLFQRFDIFVAIITLASFVLLQRKYYFWSALLLGSSIGMKFYPIVLVPFFILDISILKQKIRYGASAILGLMLSIIPFATQGASIKGMLYFWEYNKNREIQLESTWSSLSLALRPWGEAVEVYTAYGAKNLGSDHSKFFTSLAFFISIAILLACILYFWKLKKKSAHTAVTVVFLYLLCFIFFNKVFSPQYLLWLIPFFPIAISFVSLSKKIFYTALFCIIIIITHLIVPTFYLDLIDLKEYAVNLLISRNLLLGLFLILYLIDLIRSHYAKTTNRLHHPAHI